MTVHGLVIQLTAREVLGKAGRFSNVLAESTEEGNQLDYGGQGCSQFGDRTLLAP